MAKANLRGFSVLAVVLSLFLVCSVGGDYPVGDLSGDYKVDLEDLLALAGQWLDEFGCVGHPTDCADLVGDDGVDLDGFAVVSTGWLDVINLKINEFMSSNDSVIDDDDEGEGDFDDWFEIYNGEAIAVDIGGMYLTDDLSEPTKWQMPNDSPGETTIPSQGYLLIWADGQPEEGPLHVDFQLENTGEQIGLFAGDGGTLIDSITYGQQLTDISFGRYPNAGDNWHFYGGPTPGAENTGMGYLGRVAEPEFSMQRGFYESAFDLVLTCPTGGATIRYTTNGDEPTETSTLYSGPIHLSSTACLRVGAFKSDYLPSRVVTHTYLFNLSAAHKSLPVISIVGDEEESLYVPNGVTAYPTMRGIDYERPVSIEYIKPEDNSGFQANCGIRVQGSDYHRARYTIGDGPDWTSNYDKYSFKFYFRTRYDGNSRLEYPLFGLSDISSYRSFTLRGGHNDNSNPFIKDELVRRLHKDMGTYEELAGTFANVFINGEYKHYYNPCERHDEEYLQEYHDTDDQWDIMTITAYVGGAYILPVRNGDDVAWNAMFDYINTHDLSVQGNYEEFGANHLDIPQFTDYLIMELYNGNWDWPNNNWNASRRRVEGGKYRFYTWDSEAAFENVGNVAFDIYPGWAGNSGLEGEETPIAWLYRALVVNCNFRQLFADHLYKHFYHDGALTEANISDRFWELNTVMLGVLPSMNMNIPNTWIPQRQSVLFGACSTRNLWAFEGPELYIDGSPQYGGHVSTGAQLTMTAANGGAIWYTLDGSDPRVPDGDTNPAAININQTESFTLTESIHVKARTLDNDLWSALNEATYAVGPVVENLRITEIMYHPTDPNAEFIELKNIGPEPISIGLVKFTNGIDFTFPSAELAAGDYVLVAQSPAELATAAPDIPVSVQVLGPYTGRLNDGGEGIELVDAIGRTIHEFDYEDGWYEITDGIGFSLTIKDPTDTDPNSWDEKTGWRPSASIGGSPGEDDSGQVPELGAIKINELLAHSNVLYSYDWIELYNTTDTAINIGGWYLSDDNDNLKKYTIPDGTSIGAYDYYVFYENLHFGVGNPADLANVPFALSENGETLYLNSGFEGVLTGYSEEEAFDASQADVSFGRYQKSTGAFNFVAMSSPTPGWANAYPKVGPIVISEIMYNPLTEGDAEYVELLNISSSTVTLQEWDSVEGINVPWRFTDSGGITYDFPLGTTIDAGEKILLVKNLTVFEFEFGGSVPGDKFEWGEGKLDNAGEKIELSMPGDLEGLTRYYIRVDRVNYSDGSHPIGDDPWPTEPDGTGDSLTRIVLSNYGNDVANWQSDPHSPGG